jgi:hypothetical protein
MTIPTDNTLTNLNTSINQWDSLQGDPQTEYNAMMQQLEAAVAEMKADPNNYQVVNEVYTTAVGPILCQLLNPQGATLGILGATLNINAALQTFFSKMQEDANTISSTAQTNATAIAQQVAIIQNPSSSSTQIQAAQATIAQLMSGSSNAAQDLVEKLNDLLGVLQGTTPWIDANTKEAVVGATQNIASMLNLGTSLPDSAMNLATLTTAGQAASLTLAEWNAQPTPTPPQQGTQPPSTTSPTGDQQLQDFYQDFNQGNNEISTLNNATQAKVQSLSATYNEDQQITEKGLMATITLENMTQQNSRA